MAQWTTQDQPLVSQKIVPLMTDLGENLTIMQKMVKLVGTTSDTEDERKKFNAMVNNSRQTMKQATTLLGEITTRNAPLEDELFEYSNRFRRIVNDFRSKCQSCRPFKAPIIDETNPLLAASMSSKQFNPTQASYPYKYHSQSQSQSQSQHDDLFDHRYMTQVKVVNDTTMLEQNESKMEDIVSSLDEINAIYTDLLDMANDGQQNVDVLENNVISAKDYVTRGKNELLKGEGHLKKSRRNRCMLLFILITALVALVCLVWAVKHN